jgi:prepilin-type N-terminal cleavage/methylation domain-containing protein
MSKRSIYKRKSERGFTLVEMMVSLGIMTVLFIGVMDLIVTSLRLESRTTAETDSAQNSLIAIKHISNVSREALWLSLPAQTTPSLPDNGQFDTGLANVANSGIPNNPTRFNSYTDSTFISTDPTDTYTCISGMYIAFPASDTTDQVYNSSHTAIAAVPSGNLYNRLNTSSTFLLIYRSDSAGIPAPSNGSYLWEVGTDNGVSVNRAIIRDIDTSSWNAVEFDRPVNGTQYVNNEVDVKVTCGEYSIVNGVQSSDSTNGTNTTQLVGRCVSLRNYYLASPNPYLPNGTPPASTNGSRYRTD